jgi:isoamylase
MTEEDWESSFAKSIAVYLNGHGIPDLDVRGQRVTDDSFVLCFNAHCESIEFTLPPTDFGAAWVPVIYTADTATAQEAKPVTAGAKVAVDARSVMVLQASD